MKRYRLGDTTALCDPEDEMVEDPDGEWVKWEDAEKEIKTAYKSGYFTGQNSRIGSLELGTWNVCTCDNVPCSCGNAIDSSPECNCEERSSGWPLPESWICPAHGYKRR